MRVGTRAAWFEEIAVVTHFVPEFLSSRCVGNDLSLSPEKQTVPIVLLRYRKMNIDVSVDAAIPHLLLIARQESKKVFAEPVESHWGDKWDQCFGNRSDKGITTKTTRFIFDVIKRDFRGGCHTATLDLRYKSPTNRDGN